MRMIAPDLRDLNKAIEGAWAKAVTAAVRQATDGAKAEMRAQIGQQLSGKRAPTMIGSETYPKAPKVSLGAAGSIFPRGQRAELLLETFSQATTIRAKNGKWLAIPTAAVPRTGAKAGGRPGEYQRASRYMTPVEVEAEFNQELAILPVGGRRDRAVMVLDVVAAKRGGGKVKKASSRRLQQGRDIKRTVMFVLVREVNLRQRLTPEAILQHWVDRIPDLIEAALEA